MCVCVWGGGGGGGRGGGDVALTHSSYSFPVTYLTKSSACFSFVTVICFTENFFQARATHTSLRRQVSFQLPEQEGENEVE